MSCKNICSCEVNKLERQFYLVDAQVLPEVFLKVVEAKKLLAGGRARNITEAVRCAGLSAVRSTSTKTAFLIRKTAVKWPP